jgi:hypothetical protein
VGDEHDPLAQALHLEHVVAGHQQGGALLGAQTLEAGADAQGDVGIEAGSGLVEHEEGGAVQCGLDDPDECPLPG